MEKNRFLKVETLSTQPNNQIEVEVEILMARKNWQQVKDTFHDALRLDSGERDKFLDAACEGDIEFRIEVESLLISLAEAKSFLEQPVIGEIARPKSGWQLQNGQAISHYRIVSPIATGGMGEVYLAEDEQLKRRVALKILPASLLENKERLRRFQREAQIVSTLNHPNILTIFEFGTGEEMYFLASEFVQGETLRARLSNGQMTVNDALNIAVQIVSALKAAHEAGVVHRDIKPENVMIRDDGYVKVLDFGLAKLTERPTANSTAETAALLSRPGIIMGTVTYMSPEQARARSIDSRSDLFSFGVVLYEMLAGRVPFTGETTTDFIAGIIQATPRPVSSYNNSAPDDMDRIVAKCLEKDREERYQTAADLLADLKRLSKRSDASAEPAARGSTAVPRTGQPTEILAAHPTAKHAGQLRQILSVRRGIICAAILITLILGAFAYVRFGRQTSVAPQPEIKSLAVLPLKSLDAGENYLGLGIADAVIRRISQTGEVIVRPTSAVRRYLNEETDALTAARQLNADAVLEGNVQRGGDRLRVSVNLLRVSDGASLWADKFDMPMTDIFTIQDTVAQQVASRLRLQLDPSQQARLTKDYTSNPIAYEFYLKGVYSSDQRVSATKSQWETTIDFFKKAIEADPNFALAHAQLAYAYALKAVFVEPTETVWAERAKEEINRAQTLDSQLAETHLARHMLLFSVYEGYQGEAAVREVLLAQQLNPNVGHGELAYLYIHLGLEDLAARELQRASEIDPTSEFVKQMILAMYEMGGKYDEYAAHRETYHDDYTEVWYLMGKGRLEEAQKAIEELRWSANRSADIVLTHKKALLSALKGDFRAAEAEIPVVLSRHPVKDPLYHHAAYDIACIYALEGKSVEAVKWLREAVATGLPCYPLFERDAYLNNIRQAPEFIQFISEMKAQHERYKREFK